jgi:hypothetical protein
MTQQFPEHGKVKCNLCFTMPGETLTAGLWRFRNDPGHWGSSNPTVLVLGFSKGATQVNIYDRGRFEDVAFAGSRQRLKSVLVRLGLLKDGENIDLKFERDEKYFAFASLIRCSVARSPSQGQETVTSGPIIVKAFKEQEPLRLLKTCSAQFLFSLPERLKLILMLGLQDNYMMRCRQLVASLHRNEFKSINAVAYSNDRVTWVHVAHPSGANGSFNQWISDSPNTSMGGKREYASQAIQEIDGLTSYVKRV